MTRLAYEFIVPMHNVLYPIVYFNIDIMRPFCSYPAQLQRTS